MLRRPIACALLVWYLAACTAWHVQESVSPSQVISSKHPTAVRLNLADGSRMVLLEPRIAAGDSVAGVLQGTPFTVAASDVTQVAIEEVDAGMTIGVVIIGTALVVGILAATGLGVAAFGPNTSTVSSATELRRGD